MLLHEKLKDYRLILASKSPRRRTLMDGCGFTFSIADGYDVEEKYPSQMQVEEVPEFLANLKSDGYPYPLAEKEILITADTVVILGSEILGKPADRDDALRMLGAMSGRTHTVISGVCLRSERRTESFSVRTDVRFRTLGQEEIEYYVDTFRPYDKAGAYGIQEWIGYVGIEGVEGSFYNVMGLPIQSLYTNLEKFIKQ